MTSIACSTLMRTVLLEFIFSKKSPQLIRCAAAATDQTAHILMYFIRLTTLLKSGLSLECTMTLLPLKSMTSSLNNIVTLNLCTQVSPKRPRKVKWNASFSAKSVKKSYQLGLNCLVSI